MLMRKNVNNDVRKDSRTSYFESIIIHDSILTFTQQVLAKLRQVSAMLH